MGLYQILENLYNSAFGAPAPQPSTPGPRVIQLSHWDPEDGIKLLGHLNLKMTESETAAFKKHWKAAYHTSEQHFLSAACELYGVLPFAAANNTNVDPEIRKTREAEFTQAVQNTTLDDWMHE